MSFNTYSREPMTLDQLTALAIAEGWDIRRTTEAELEFERDEATLSAWEDDGFIHCEFRGQGGCLGESEERIFTFGDDDDFETYAAMRGWDDDEEDD